MFFNGSMKSFPNLSTTVLPFCFCPFSGSPPSYFFFAVRDPGAILKPVLSHSQAYVAETNMDARQLVIDIAGKHKHSIHLKLDSILYPRPAPIPVFTMSTGCPQSSQSSKLELQVLFLYIPLLLVRAHVQSVKKPCQLEPLNIAFA